MTAPLRPNVCILLYNKQHNVLLGERLGHPDTWQFPQGGADLSFSLEENVIREIEEELGILPRYLGKFIKLKATHQYEFPKEREYPEGVFSGQSQTFWLVEFLGTDSDINVETDEPEFSDWCWCELEEVAFKAEKKRVRGYQEPIEEARQILEKLG